MARFRMGARSIAIWLGGFLFQAGWFPGEPIRMLGVTVLEYDKDIRWLVVFDVAILHFSVGIHFCRDR